MPFFDDPTHGSTAVFNARRKTNTELKGFLADCNRHDTPQRCKADLIPFVLKQRKRKTETAIQFECTGKLRELERAQDLPEGLRQLVKGTRTMIGQKWKTFILFFAFDKEFPDFMGIWSKTEWRKWDVIELLTMMCGQYYREFLQAKQVGVELCTKAVDEEYLSFVEDLLALGSGEEKIIAIKEWERDGTQETMGKRILVSEDVYEDRGDTEEFMEVGTMDAETVTKHVGVHEHR